MRLVPRIATTCAVTGVLLSVASWARVSGDSLSLIEAVKAGNRDAIREILKTHPDVNRREPDGTTALHWAVRANDEETARLLLSSGAQVNAANRYGVAPLS